MPVEGEPRLIERQRNPDNLESPFPALAESFLTPNELFYVRSHFHAPAIHGALWRLRVDGAVANPISLHALELRDWMPRELTATLECAGNHRTALRPKPKGVAWERGAVSTAHFKGIPLSDVLGRAQVKDSAVEIVLAGADSGTVPDEPKQAPNGTRYAFSISIERALRGNVLLAYEMNGEPLPIEHGYPLRAVVPGCYGMASVKWLIDVIAVETPFRGYFNTLDYAVWRPDERNIQHRVPLEQMQPKCVIVNPEADAMVPEQGEFTIKGLAWGGDAAIQRVEVSVDGGENWQEARFPDDAVPHAWRFWEYRWPAPRGRGKQELRARAIDANRCVQASEHDPRNGAYVIDQIQPVKVYVRR